MKPEEKREVEFFVEQRGRDIIINQLDSESGSGNGMQIDARHLEQLIQTLQRFSSVGFNKTKIK